MYKFLITFAGLDLSERGSWHLRRFHYVLKFFYDYESQTQPRDQEITKMKF